MAEPLNLDGIQGLSADRPDMCTVEASCVTGFEPMAKEEIQERLGCEGILHRGRIVVDIPVDRVPEMMSLLTVNNLSVILAHTHEFQYPESTEDQLDAVAEFAVNNSDWEKGLNVWKKATEAMKVLNLVQHPKRKPNQKKKPNCEFSKMESLESTSTVENSPVKVHNPTRSDEIQPSSDQVHPPEDDVSAPLVSSNDEAESSSEPKAITFRCTCYRSGTNHKFQSNEMQIAVGGKIHDKFQWKPKMKDYQLEVVVNCDVNQVYVCIALTNISLFNRTITHFGPTSLRPTICAAMIRLAKVKPGEVVLDPMCGGGSIPVEGCIMDRRAFYIGGDTHDLAITRTGHNIRDIKHGEDEKRGWKVDAFRWNALNPCLRDNSVDVIISDLPFGKRSGSEADNRVLYPSSMIAMARLVRPSTGRAVLLTQDRVSMLRSLNQFAQYWRLQKSFSCNIGGLSAIVFLFNRTSELFSSK